MRTLYIKIDGIHCSHCTSVIRAALMKLPSVQSVHLKNNIAAVRCAKPLSPEVLAKTICDAGYVTKPEWISQDIRNLRDHVRIAEYLLILSGILLFSWLLKRIFGFDIFSMIPTIDSTITFGMLTVTGLLTSIHCVSMCGAINLSVAAGSSKAHWLNPLVYNVGRLLSYTFIGGMVGAIGSVFTLSNRLTGMAILLAGAVMLLMALSMLGMLDFHLPSLFNLHVRSGNAFAVGLLNGLMPCGPLQAMQLYALSTGNWTLGALSMFLFGIGTVPAMLLVGILASYLSGRRRAILNKVSAVLILVLAVSMVSRGLLALGVDISGSSSERDDYLAATMYDSYQQVEFDLNYGSYADIVVQKGVPVRMVIHADSSRLTGCNNAIKSGQLGFSSDLHAGENVILFTPDEEGSYPYACWMDMIRNTIFVIDDPDYFTGDKS